MSIKNKLTYITILFGFVLTLSLVSGITSSIGTFKQGDCFELIQTCDSCTYNNLSNVVSPNSTIYLPMAVMQQTGTYYNHSFCNTNQLGSYVVNGFGDLSGTKTIWVYAFEITSSGNETPSGVPTFYGIILVIIFGISCFFLFFSIKISEVGPKIFFMLASLIFLIGSVGLGVVMAEDVNVGNSVSGLMGNILFVLGMIFIVIFFYIFIRQVVSILELYKTRGGYSMKGYSSQGAY